LPRIVGDKAMMPADLKRLKPAKLNGFDVASSGGGT
jgi:hypothetical protein